MTWEETIQHIRTEPKYKDLVADAYFSEDIVSNVERYRNTQEFRETLKQLRQFKSAQKSLSILDLGAGNGISTIALALEGYQVTALEPDLSPTIGSGAIKKLKAHYQLPNVDILTCYAEDIPANQSGYDIVFARQAMHHAYHLENFVAAAYRALKPEGIFITIRDHVVNDATEKEKFLVAHPLHKFYGGENAYSLREYQDAIQKAGFTCLKTWRPTDTAINYHPWSKELLKNKLGILGNFNVIVNMAWAYMGYRWNRMPGRLYTFISKK